jgi:hypothetical protein
VRTNFRPSTNTCLIIEVKHIHRAGRTCSLIIHLTCLLSQYGPSLICPTVLTFGANVRTVAGAQRSAESNLSDGRATRLKAYLLHLGERTQMHIPMEA